MGRWTANNWAMTAIYCGEKGAFYCLFPLLAVKKAPRTFAFTTEEWEGKRLHQQMTRQSIDAIHKQRAEKKRVTACLRRYWNCQELPAQVMRNIRNLNDNPWWAQKPVEAIVEDRWVVVAFEEGSAEKTLWFKLIERRRETAFIQATVSSRERGK